MADEVTVTAPTEGRLPQSVDIDRMSTLDVLRVINDQDATVADAVAATLPRLAELVDAAVDRVRTGGKVHYFGAGTSGRMAVIDAAELLPTFNVPPGMVVAHHAGGERALITAVENVEDDADLGAAEAAEVTASDVVIGLTASGRTPYVAGALRVSRSVGAVTALVTANPDAEIGPHVDHLLAADTGPEVITGSTRLKAGTAQKMVLNAFSTALMIRLGRTWSNLMVDLLATNAKLRGRTVRILVQATGAEETAARAQLSDAGGELKPALLALLSGVSPDTARELLAANGGSVAAALAEVLPEPAVSGTPAGTLDHSSASAPTEHESIAPHRSSAAAPAAGPTKEDQ